MRIFMLPTANRLLSFLFFLVDYQVFFSVLYAHAGAGQRLKAALCCAVIYFLTFGFTVRHFLFLILITHAVITLLCAWLLNLQTGVPTPHALYLAVAFIICRGTWNAQMLRSLFPFIPPVNVTLPTELFSLCFLLLAKRFLVRFEPDFAPAWKEVFSELFPACAMFTARIAIYHYCYYLEGSMTAGASRVFSWIGTFLALATICSLAANEVLFSYNQSRRQLALAQAQLKRQYEAFSERRRNDEQLKRLHHDMANHLSILREMKNPDEIRQYIGSLDQHAAALEECDTGNETLNLLLLQKSEACRKSGLSLEAAILAPREACLTPMEICTLFANCIDNAMEAASDARVADKTIRVSGSVQHGCWVVRFENAYAHALQYAENRIASSKGDPLHGYGLQNVRAVLDQHGGTLSIHPKDGRFVLTFMIPVSQLSVENAQLP